MKLFRKIIPLAVIIALVLLFVALFRHIYSPAFQAFKETSLYDPQTARVFRDNILAAGGTDDPMTMYIRFRGAEPKIDALLQRRGLK